MDGTQINQKVAKSEDGLFHYVKHLMTKQGKSPLEIKSILAQKGVSVEIAAILSQAAKRQIAQAGKRKAMIEILIGVLLCVTGTIAVFTDFGAIFWIAVIFGGVQSIHGLMVLSSE